MHINLRSVPGKTTAPLSISPKMHPTDQMSAFFKQSTNNPTKHMITKERMVKCDIKFQLEYRIPFSLYPIARMISGER